MALKIGRMGRLVRPTPKFLDSWESHHLSKAALKRSLNFWIFIDTTGTLILAHCVKCCMHTCNWVGAWHFTIVKDFLGLSTISKHGIYKILIPVGNIIFLAHVWLINYINNNPSKKSFIKFYLQSVQENPSQLLFKWIFKTYIKVLLLLSLNPYKLQMDFSYVFPAVSYIFPFLFIESPS